MTLKLYSLVVVGAYWLGLAPLASAQVMPPTGDALAGTPTLSAPKVEQVREQAMQWLKEQKLDAAVLQQAEALWNVEPEKTGGNDLLHRVAATFALGDPRAKALIDQCSRVRVVLVLPDQAWLKAEAGSAFMRHNLRLYYARWLAHERLYDEMLETLDGLEPSDVVDPASLLFYQSVAYHRLLKKDEGIKSIERLLLDVADSPHRYRSLATLMKMDLEDLDPKTLDHISRRMDDIQRHLELGRAGKKVVQIENGVIQSLDEIIKKMEDEEKKKKGGGGGSSAQRPSTPMPDSQLAPAQGPGETEHKPLGGAIGWGDLPAKDREAALQQIGKDFPSHYREAIEQYFRKLAAEGSERNK